MDLVLTRLLICTMAGRSVFVDVYARDESAPVGKRLARAAGDHFSRQPDRAVYCLERT